MPKKRFSAEQIVTLLRQIEVSMAQGKPTPVACRYIAAELRDECLNQEIFYSLKEAGLQVVNAYVKLGWSGHFEGLIPCVIRSASL